jgi:hypothetical protein
MARREAPREDLLREATALVDRIELTLPGRDASVVVGFRKDGCASIYFGEDPALHFNSRGHLRRAYDDGRLLKAERGQLVELTRRRTSDEVQLLRRPWPVEETRAFLTALGEQLTQLRGQLLDRQYRVVGMVSTAASADILIGRIVEWLEPRGTTLEIARQPNAR